MDEPKKDEPQRDAAKGPGPEPTPLKCASCGAPLRLPSPVPADARVQCEKCETWHALAPGPDGKTVATVSAAALDMRLVGLCVLLWVVAIGIFFSSWEDTKKDYYWGNIRQALEQPMGGYLDVESVKALSAMGDSVLPSCERELHSQPDELYRCAVLRVLQDVPTEKARQLLAGTVQQDPDARVRANALLILRDRARKNPSEKAALTPVAQERVTNEKEVAARAIAGVVFAEGGDSSPDTKSLLVYALRIVPLRKDAWSCLKALAPTVPAVDAAKEDEAQKQIMGVEAWCKDNGIAFVGSPLEATPPPGPAPGGSGAPAPDSGSDRIG